jgi:hypothetical protein
VQYFLNPTVAHEPVPEQLELIAKELLAPLHGIFHHLVQQVLLHIFYICKQDITKRINSSMGVSLFISNSLLVDDLIT